MPKMIRRSLIILGLTSLTFCSPAAAQPTHACLTNKADSLACLTVDLISANLKSFGLSPTLLSGSATGATVFASQLSSASPTPSPASGFTYTFDPGTGIFARSTLSYGPILSERADTIGRYKISFGVTDQYFNFTHFDGVAVSHIPVYTELAPDASLAGILNLRFRLNQLTVFGTFGVTNNLDLSVALPVVHTELGGTFPQHAYFGSLTQTANASLNRSATGIGDVQLQMKYEFLRRGPAGLALGVNVRTPTGDAYDLLGAGAIGIQPFVVASATVRRLSPHLKVSYQWNGQSVLAGDVDAVTRRPIAGNISYATGAELVINSRITAIADLLGAELIHGNRIVIDSANPSHVPGVGFYNASYNQSSGSVGVKVNPGGNFLIVANILFRLNQGGLTVPIVPLIGLSYVR